MAQFIRHTSCDKCGSSDARAHYSDGGTYCFSCGSSNRATRPSFVEEDEKSFTLPDDLDKNYPESVYNWIKPTGLTFKDLIKHDYYFSHSTKRLWRLVADGCAESRRVEANDYGPKSRFYGSKYSVKGIVAYCPSSNQHAEIHLVPMSPGRPNGESANCTPLQPRQNPTAEAGRGTLILVEDSLSAIKCSRFSDAVPLFGSTVDNNKLARLVQPYSTVLVWLDSDKFTTAQSIAVRAQLLGSNAKVVYTQKDPKYENPYAVLQA